MTIELKTGDKSMMQFNLPESWADVEPSVWKFFLHLRFACMVEEVTAENGLKSTQVVLSDYIAARVALENICPGIEPHLSLEVVDAIIEELQWLKEFPTHDKSMRSRMGIWYGPKNQLIDWTWGRYCLAEECFRSYADAVRLEDEKLAMKALNTLFAVLYAPFGIWNAKLADVYVKLARMVDKEKKAEAVENYGGMRSWIQSVYAPAFEGGSGDSDQDSGDTMRSLTVAMAGPKFGTVKQVLKENLHNVMIYQCQLMNEVQRMQQA